MFFHTPLQVDTSLSDFEQLQHILKHCYQQQPGIPLLLDESKGFPISKLFVDLELLEVKEEKASPEVKKAAPLEDCRREFLPEAGEERQVIAPKDLFQADSTHPTPIRRIFLQGAAGIGKTTLGRYLLYAYATGSLFTEHFEVMLYLPLRELVLTYEDTPSRRQNGYSLEELLLGDWEDSAVFHQKGLRGQRLIEAPHKKALWAFIQQCPEKVLWVLDGLDEVDRNHPAIHAFLTYTESYLVLSRPQAAPTRCQRQVVNVGFSQPHIEQYIHSYFTLMEQPKLAQTLLATLKSQPQLWSFCSIAINAQLFCGAWQEISASHSVVPIDFTLTDRYDFAMRQWQKRALRRDTTLTPKEWELLTDKSIQALCEDRMQVLRVLCLRVLQGNGVIMPGEWLEVAIEQVLQERNEKIEMTTKEHLLKAVLDIGVIKRQGLHLHYFKDQYEMAHLTFMEYLVGETLAQGFSAPTSTPAFVLACDLLKNYQHHSKWVIVWRFVAGHLAKKQQGGLLTFLTGLLEGPEDLEGENITVQLMHCYEEAFPYAKFSEEFNAAFLTFFNAWFLHVLSTYHSYSGFSVRLKKAFEQCPRLVQRLYQQATGSSTDIIPAIYRKMLQMPNKLPTKEASINYERLSLLLSLLAPRISNEQGAPWLVFLQQRWLEADKEERGAVVKLLQAWLPQLSNEQLAYWLALLQQRWLEADRYERPEVVRLLQACLPRLSKEQLAYWLTLLQQLWREAAKHERLGIVWHLQGCLLQLSDEQLAPWLALLQQHWLEVNDDERRQVVRLLRAWLPRLSNEQLAPWFALLQQRWLKADENERKQVVQLLRDCVPQLSDEQWAPWLTFLQQRWLKAVRGEYREAIELLQACLPRLSDEQLATWLAFLQQHWLKAVRGEYREAIELLQACLPRLSDEQLATWLAFLQQHWPKANEVERRQVVWLLQACLPRLSHEQLAYWLTLLQQRWPEGNKDEREAVIGLWHDCLPRLSNEQLGLWLAFLQQRWSKMGKYERWAVIALLYACLPRLSNEQLATWLALLQQGWSKGDEDEDEPWGIVALLQVCLPRLSNEQLATWQILLQQGLIREDRSVYAELFIALLPLFKKPSLYTTTLFKEGIGLRVLKEIKERNLLCFKPSAHTLCFVQNDVPYYFNLPPAQMAALQEKFTQLQPATHGACMKQLCKALLNTTDRLQQVPMATFSGHYPRNYVGGFAELKPEQWAVSLVRKKSKHLITDLTTHVFIILEGFEEGQERLMKIHLTVNKTTGTVSITEEPISDIQWLKSLTPEGYCYKGWQISTLVKQQLEQAILRDQQAAARGQLVYNQNGDGKLYRLRFLESASYHNCLSWAEAKLKDIGLPMTQHWLDMVVTLPNRHLPDHFESAVTPSKCVIA